MREEHRVGIQYLEEVTILCQRVRAAHPTAGEFEAGAQRIKICFEQDTPSAKGLYLSVGFEPVKQCATVSRPI